MIGSTTQHELGRNVGQLLGACFADLLVLGGGMRVAALRNRLRERGAKHRQRTKHTRIDKVAHCVKTLRVCFCTGVPERINRFRVVIDDKARIVALP